MESVSHTILVSGVTLASCFLSLAFFPVSCARSPPRHQPERVSMVPVDRNGYKPRLSLSFFFLSCLIFFRTRDLRFPGISTAIAVLVTVSCNLSLLPCMLLLFPRYFSHANCNWCLPAFHVRDAALNPTISRPPPYPPRTRPPGPAAMHRCQRCARSKLPLTPEGGASQKSRREFATAPARRRPAPTPPTRRGWRP